MSLSAVVLTKNEQKNIGKSIKNLSFCDEIIVVDDCSTDKTVEFAKDLGAKVFVRDMNKNFSDQSNFGMKKAKSDWIFFIDADEKVTKKLSDEIKSAISKTNCKGFFLKRRDFLWGKLLKHGESGNTKVLRLVKKKSGKWKRRVHPRFEISGEIGFLKNPILHYPHQTIKKFVSSIDQWSGWHALANSEEGKRSSCLKIIFWPGLKFIYNFILKLGFLDGIQGFISALMMSFHSYLSWSKLWLIQKQK